jgi:hypothetical protein
MSSWLQLTKLCRRKHLQISMRMSNLGVNGATGSGQASNFRQTGKESTHEVVVDGGAAVNVMPYTTFRKLGMGPGD